MMKSVGMVLLLCMAQMVNVFGQSTGSFERTIDVQGASKEMSCYVPSTYDASNDYPLIVALHGCGGNAMAYRDEFMNWAETLEAILICPNNYGMQFDDGDIAFLDAAIDSTANVYAIDASSVYLTGFSCNGKAAIWLSDDLSNSIKGVIPLNPYIGVLDASYDYDSEILKCICTGDMDSQHGLAQQYHDSVLAHGKPSKLNVMPGVAHEWIFQTRDAELTECLNWIDSTANAPVGVIELLNQNITITTYPNPMTNELNIRFEQVMEGELELQIIEPTGKWVLSNVYTNTDNINVDVTSWPSGMYGIRILQESKLVGIGKVMKVK